jgi:sugar phosphate isomerase/epimerase
MQIAFSTLACPGWSIEEAAEAAVRYGYDAIEWRMTDGRLIGPRAPDQVWERMDRAARSRGLSVVCLDTSCRFVHADDDEREKSVADAIAMARRAAELGAPAIRVFGGALEGIRREDVLLRAADALARVVDSAGGVKVLIETHDDWAGSGDALDLARAAGAGVLWDVHHPFRMGESPAESARRLGDAVGLVHVKDGSRSGALYPLGEGDVPLGEVIAALRDIGYGGALSFEWEKAWHPELEEPEVALPHALAVMRKLLSAA